MPTSKVYFTVSGQPAAVGGEVTFITKYITQSVTHLPRYTSQRHHPEQVDVATRVCRLDVAQPVPTQPAEVHGWTASSEWTRDGLQNNTQTHQNITQTHGHAMACRKTHKHIRTTHKHIDTPCELNGGWWDPEKGGWKKKKRNGDTWSSGLN